MDDSMKNAVKYVSTFIEKRQYETLRNDLLPLSLSTQENEMPDKWYEIMDSIATDNFNPNMVHNIEDPKYLQQVISKLADKTQDHYKTKCLLAREKKEMGQEITRTKNSKKYYLGLHHKNQDSFERKQSSLAFLCQMISEGLRRYPSEKVIIKLILQYFIFHPHQLNHIVSDKYLLSIIEGIIGSESNRNAMDRSLMKQFSLFVGLPINSISLRAYDRLGRLLHQRIPLQQSNILDENGILFVIIMIFITKS